MKHLKMFGLAAIAALGLLAFAGASSASATVLCKTAVDPCPEGWRWSSGTEIHATLKSGTDARETEGELVRDTCTESTFNGDQENEGGATETVTIDFTGISINSCATTRERDTLPTKLEIHQIPGTHNGTLTGVGKVTLAWLGSNCFYSATHVGTLTGGENPTLDVESALTRTEGSGFLCPFELGWDATYSITEPSSSLFVTEG